MNNKRKTKADINVISKKYALKAAKELAKYYNNNPDKFWGVDETEDSNGSLTIDNLFKNRQQWIIIV